MWYAMRFHGASSTSASGSVGKEMTLVGEAETGGAGGEAGSEKEEPDEEESEPRCRVEWNASLKPASIFSMAWNSVWRA
jgi:hypothetical protein